MKSIGIDIGTSSIKWIEIQETSKGLQVTRFAEVDLGKNPAYDTDLEVLEFLKNIRNSQDFSRARVVVGLNQEQVSLRRKFFPFSDRIKILKSLPFELEEDLPYSSESAIFEAKILSIQGPQTEVLCCASPKTRIAAALDRFQEGGISLTILTPEGLALSSLYEKWQDPPPVLLEGEYQFMEEEGKVPPPKKLHFLLQMGHSKTLFLAFQDQRLMGVRSIPLGGRHIAEAIQHRYQIPYVEALKELQTKGFVLVNTQGASLDQVGFSETIASVIHKMGNELKITALELQAELGGFFEQGRMTGGMSQIRNLHALMTQILEVPVNPISFLTQYSSTQKSSIDFTVSSRIDAIVGPALGLAIEGLRRPRNPAINFLREEFSQQNRLIQEFLATWGWRIQAGGIAFAVLLTYSCLRDQFSQSLSDRTRERLQTQGKVVAHLKKTSPESIKKYIRQQKDRIHSVTSLTKYLKMNSALDVMKKISDTLPEKSQVNLNVDHLSIEDSQVTIQGTVGNAVELNTLQKALSEISTNGKIQSKGLTEPSFEYTFEVDRGIASSQKTELKDQREAQKKL